MDPNGIERSLVQRGKQTNSTQVNDRESQEARGTAASRESGQQHAPTQKSRNVMPIAGRGPTFKDQVRSNPGNNSAAEDADRGIQQKARNVIPIAGRGPAFKDQVRSNPDNNGAHQQIPTAPAAVYEEAASIADNRLPHYKDQVRPDPADQTSLPKDGDITQNDDASNEEVEQSDFSAATHGEHGQPELSAVLVHSNADIMRAEEIVHSKAKQLRRYILLVVAMVVVLAIGVVAGICGNGSCVGSGDASSSSSTILSSSTFAPKPPPSTLAPASTPSMAAASNTCSLDFDVECTLPADFIVPSQPCAQYRRPLDGFAFPCVHRPIAATLLFIGGSCEKDYQEKLFNCTDFNGGPPIEEGEKVHVKVTDDDGTGAVLYEGIVSILDWIHLYNNGDLFGDLQKITVSSPDQDTLLQEAQASFNCSHPLELLRIFGANQVIEYYNTQQGLITVATYGGNIVDLLVTAVAADNDTSVELTSVIVSSFLFESSADVTESILYEGNLVDSNNFVQSEENITLDSYTLRSYTFDFYYEGMTTSAAGNASFCNGTDSASFVFGIVGDNN